MSSGSGPMAKNPKKAKKPQKSGTGVRLDSGVKAVAKRGAKPGSKRVAEPKGTPRAKAAADSPAPESDVPIVGIGASAGGFEALESFLRGVPKPCGLAFVIVQHLDPTHEAMLSGLLQRRTEMPVVQARDRTRVEAGRVYVIPPNRDMSVMHGVLHLFAPAAPRGLRLPIDYFLRTLAADRRERSIAVILSGMGTDGTLGVKAIKEVGGLVLAQTPTDAKFDGMPRSVVDTGLVDVVAHASELCGRILSLLAHPPLVPAVDSPAADQTSPSLEKILVLLRSRTGHDFTAYKKSTLHRRIERRMGIHQLSKSALYLRYLQENPQELDLLFKELLIGVTSFFRDPATWELLGSRVLPELIDGCADGATLRAWTPGCSTGEEAYSLAMAFKESLDQHRPGRRVKLQIFATDLDPNAIQQARQGVYPPNIAVDVGVERLERNFVQEEGAGDGRPGRLRIAKEIREMVTLATQNALSDPPFTRLNLLVCRNLLIYLEPAAQAQLLSIFHYSLKPGGVLVLGSSESVGTTSDLFEPLDPKLRIFRRREPSRALPIGDLKVSAGVPSTPEAVEQQAPGGSLQEVADRALLLHHSPAAVLVNPEGDILYISGRTGKFLEPAAGKANFNLFAMARDGLRQELPRVLKKAARDHSSIKLPGVRVRTDAGTQKIDVTVEAMAAPDELRGLLFVVFSEAAAAATRLERRGARKTALDAQEPAIESLRAEILSLEQEMQASQEELKSANEELQSTNEELQSTNEELTTSKEEMQSLNEELQTVNAELRSKLDELMHANNDMRNLLNSTEIATLFLDEALNVRRFTTKATRIFRLIPTDLGRPITDVASDLEYGDLKSDVAEVLETLVSIEKQVETRDGRWFSARMMPYRTVDNVIDGVVLTFSEITIAKRLEQELRDLGRVRQKPSERSEKA